MCMTRTFCSLGVAPNVREYRSIVKTVGGAGCFWLAVCHGNRTYQPEREQDPVALRRMASAVSHCCKPPAVSGACRRMHFTRTVSVGYEGWLNPAIQREPLMSGIANVPVGEKAMLDLGGPGFPSNRRTRYTTQADCVDLCGSHTERVQELPAPRSSRLETPAYSVRRMREHCPL